MENSFWSSFRINFGDNYGKFLHLWGCEISFLIVESLEFFTEDPRKPKFVSKNCIFSHQIFLILPTHPSLLLPSACRKISWFSSLLFFHYILTFNLLHDYHKKEILPLSVCPTTCEDKRIKIKLSRKLIW